LPESASRPCCLGVRQNRCDLARRRDFFLPGIVQCRPRPREVLCASGEARIDEDRTLSGRQWPSAPVQLRDTGSMQAKAVSNTIIGPGGLTVLIVAIYPSRNGATVVSLGVRARQTLPPVTSFVVTADDNTERPFDALAAMISQGCIARKLELSKVCVAVDCAMFMEHNIHSEFTDPQKITATRVDSIMNRAICDPGSMRICQKEHGSASLRQITFSSQWPVLNRM
jgi:hypothetical protein